MMPQPVYVKRFEDDYPDYDPSLNGIGGWLILIIIGRFITMIDIFSIGKLQSSYGYSASLDAYITITICFAIIVEVLLSILILVFIFSRKKVFRILFTIQGALVIIFTFCSATYFSGYGVNTFSSSLIQAIIGGAIWIPYVFISKRVKNTFIYPKLYQDYENMYGYTKNYPAYTGSGEGLNMNAPKPTYIIPKAPAPPDESHTMNDIRNPGSDWVVCPACNTVQRSDQYFCSNCGARFRQ